MRPTLRRIPAIVNPLVPLTVLWLLLIVWQRRAIAGVVPSDDALLIWEFYLQRIAPAESLAQALSHIKGEFNNVWLFLPLKALDLVEHLTYSNALTVAAATSLAIGLVVAAFLAWSGLNQWVASLAGASIMLSLAQVEYLTFYVPIQHAVTILYALLLTWLTASLVYATPSQPLRSVRWWAWLGLLGTSWTVRTPILVVLFLLIVGGLALTKARCNDRLLIVGPITTAALIALLATLSTPGTQILTFVTRFCPLPVCSVSGLSTAMLSVTSLILTVTWALVVTIALKPDEGVSSRSVARDIPFRVRGLGGLAAVVTLVLVLIAAPIAIASVLFISPISASLVDSVPARWLVSQTSLLAISVAAVLWVAILWTLKSAAAVAFVSASLVATSAYFASRGHLSGLTTTLPDAVNQDQLLLDRYALYVVVPFACALALTGNRVLLMMRDWRAWSHHRQVSTAVLCIFAVVLVAPWIATVPTSVKSAIHNLSDLRLTNISITNGGLPEATICTQGFTARWIEGQNRLPDFPSVSLKNVEERTDLSPQSLEILASTVKKEWSSGPCFETEIPSAALVASGLSFEVVSGVGNPTAGLGNVGAGTGRSLIIVPDIYRVQGAAQVIFLARPLSRLDADTECAAGSIVFDWEGAHVKLDQPDGSNIASKDFPIIGTENAALRFHADGQELTFSTDDFVESWTLPDGVCLNVDHMAIESAGGQSLLLVTDPD